MGEIFCSLQQHILTVQINRLEKRNALNKEMYSLLAEAFTKANSDNDVRVVVLTGGKECFTGGNDLSDFLNDPPQAIDAPVFQFMESLVNLDKPLIAAVCGAAIGIGTTVLAHCDLVFVTRNSKFCMPFVRLGICPEFGASVMFPMILGALRARYLLLTGDAFCGEQAVDWGLATFAFDTAEECMAYAEEQARKLAEAPQGALLSSKKILKGVSPEALITVIRKEAGVLIDCLKSKETREVLDLLAR